MSTYLSQRRAHQILKHNSIVFPILLCISSMERVEKNVKSAGKSQTIFSLCVLLAFHWGLFLLSLFRSSPAASMTLLLNKTTVWQLKKEKKKIKTKDRKLFEKSLIRWAFSAFLPQSDAAVVLKNPCAAVRLRDLPLLPSFSPPSLPYSHLSPLTHTRAGCLPLILQIVSKTCLCSISAKASPVIDQLQQNQLQAF